MSCKFLIYSGDVCSDKKFYSDDLSVESSLVYQSHLFQTVKQYILFSVSVQFHLSLYYIRDVISEPDILHSTKRKTIDKKN